MESRKYQLQQQIIEALKASDDDLYSLLRSQWAHRFGVESLEELKNLEVTPEKQNLTIEDNKDTDQSQDYLFQADKEIAMKNDEYKEKEIIKDTNNQPTTVDVENKESLEIKSNEIIDAGSDEKLPIKHFGEYKISPKIEALIPLPPKPKYGYLKKWIK